MNDCMDLMPATWIVGQTPVPGDFLSIYKIVTILVSFVGWAYVTQWVDRDTDKVKTKRERWNLIVLSGGLAGLAVLFVIPWTGVTFFLGLTFWLLLAAGAQVVYVVHRNGRVVASRRVLTVGYFKRLITRSEDSATAKVDKGQRIELAGADGKNVRKPSDLEEFEQYNATQDFLFDVLWRRATDVDVLLTKEKVRVIYRIDGVAIERNDFLEPEDAERAIVYLKKLAGLNSEEIRRPQQGTIEAALLGHSGDLGKIQVITSGSAAGERLRLKVRTPQSLKRLDELGLAASRLEQLKKWIKVESGMVLVSGLKQGGVTTTQYAIIRSHDAFMQNIHSLERNPTHEIDNITQTKYGGSSVDVTYARQLQSVLRREPEVILVGECADHDTAEIALRAAARDRKIYMAIEAKSTFDALSRLMGFAEDNELVAEALVAVVSQRLIRILCTACRQSFKPEESLLRKANLPVDKIEFFHRPPTEPVYDRKGREIICQTCQGSGYLGRTAVFEAMGIDDAIRELIKAGAPIKQIKAQARKNKMYYMQEEGLFKVIDGTTSLDEVIRGLRDDAK